MCGNTKGSRTKGREARCVCGVLAVLLSSVVSQVSAEPDDPKLPTLFSSSTGKIPPSWQALVFPKIKDETRYEMIQEGRDTSWVVRASSRGSASGLMHPVEIDLTRTPLLRWRWKVENVIEGGDARKKEGDDYAARIYLTFDVPPADLGFWDRAALRIARALYGDVPGRGINYIWASTVEKGMVLDSAYVGSFTKLVAVESGAEHVGAWRSEERNVYRDYVSFYGKPPPPVSGVAIMTDSDDTGGNAIAFYGDIEFRDTTPITSTASTTSTAPTTPTTPTAPTTPTTSKTPR